jgi:hypothetical protein
MRTHTTIISCLGLLFLAAVSPGGDRKEAEDALAQAAKKGAGLASYSFRIEEGPAQTVEGKYQKDQPVWFKADRIELFKKGNTLVYKQGENWQRSKTGRESDPLLVLVAVAKVRSARLPHEELAGFEKNFKEVKKTEEKDGVLYSGPLTADAAKNLARSEHQGLATSGSARVWVNGKGEVTKYETVIKLQGRLGNADFNGESKKTVTLTDAGDVKVEVPKAVKQLLE